MPTNTTKAISSFLPYHSAISTHIFNVWYWKRKQINETHSRAQLTPTHFNNTLCCCCCCREHQRTAASLTCTIHMCVWIACEFLCMCFICFELVYIQGVRRLYLSYNSFYLVSTLAALRHAIHVYIVDCSVFHYTRLCVCVHVVFYTVSLRSFRIEIALISSAAHTLSMWRECIVLLTSTIHHRKTSSQSSFSVQVW